MIFTGPFLINPPRGWRVEWTDDIERTFVYCELPNTPRRVWRLTRKREHHGARMYYHAEWPD